MPEHHSCDGLQGHNQDYGYAEIHHHGDRRPGEPDEDRDDIADDHGQRTLLCPLQFLVAVLASLNWCV